MPAIYHQSSPPSIWCCCPFSLVVTIQDRLHREHTSPRIEARVFRRVCTGCARTDRERYVRFCILLPVPVFFSNQHQTDVRVEQDALRAQQNMLPEPTLDLCLLSYSAAAPTSISAYTNNQQPITAHNIGTGSAAATATATRRSTSASTSATVVVPPPDDPWMTGVTLYWHWSWCWCVSVRCWGWWCCFRRRTFRGLGYRLGGERDRRELRCGLRDCWIRAE